MSHDPFRFVSSTPVSAAPPRRFAPLRSAAVLSIALSVAGASQAVEFGPFSLTGFANAEVGLGSNVCENCQLRPNEDRHRNWADDLALGKSYGTETTHGWQFQPTLSANFDLGQGFKLSGAISQRLRDGKEYNIPSCPIAIPSSIAMVLNSAAKQPNFSISSLTF